MTGDVLEALVRLNIAGSAAILAVLALRKPLRSLAGARLAYGLWLLVPLVAAAAFLPARQAPMDVVASLPRYAPAQVNAPLAEAIGGLDRVVFAGESLGWFLLALWGAGAAASLAFVLWRHSQFVREIGRVRRRADGVMQAERSKLGPAVVGVMTPKIVLPADFEARFNPSEQTLIIAHEARHVSAGHVQLTALVVLAQCLSWFNPLAHLAARLLRIDQELACDEAVIDRHPSQRRTYAEAMLKTQLAETSLALGCYWPSRSHHPLKERIAMLKRDNPGRVRRWAGAAVVSALAASGGYGAWAAQPPRPVPPAEEATDAQARPVWLDARGQPVPAPPQARPAVRSSAGSPQTLPPRPPEPYRARRIAGPGPVPAPPRPSRAALPLTMRLDPSGGPVPARPERPSRVQAGAAAKASRVPAPPGARPSRLESPVPAPPGARPEPMSLGPPVPRPAAPAPAPAPDRFMDRPQPIPAPPLLIKSSVVTDPTPSVLRPSDLIWLRRPTAVEMSHAFPEREMRWRREGAVRLRCRVGADGGLESCKADTSNRAFAEAALGLVPKFRLNPTTRGGQSVEGATVVIPMAFIYPRQQG